MAISPMIAISASTASTKTATENAMTIARVAAVQTITAITITVATANPTLKSVATSPTTLPKIANTKKMTAAVNN